MSWVKTTIKTYVIRILSITIRQIVITDNDCCVILLSSHNLTVQFTLPQAGFISIPSLIPPSVTLGDNRKEKEKRQR